MVAEARGCGANLLAVWNALFLTQWAQSLSLSANSLLYISLFSSPSAPLVPPSPSPLSFFFTPSSALFRICFFSPLLFKDALLRLPHTQLNYSNPPLLFFFILMQIPNIVPAYVNSSQHSECAPSASDCVHLLVCVCMRMCRYDATTPPSVCIAARLQGRGSPACSSALIPRICAA